MEKSGLLKLTQSEIDVFTSTHVVPKSVMDRWGPTASAELEAIIQSGRYDLI